MSFWEELEKCTNEESEVQPLYRAEIIKFLKKGDNYNSKRAIYVGKTDGIIPGKYIKEIDGKETDIPFLLLLECKKDETFKDNKIRNRTLLQVVCMLKEMKEKGEDLPKVIVLGSKKDCFSLPIDCLLPYIDKDIVGYTSASTAYNNKDNKKILKDISEDNNISKSSSIIYDNWVDMSLESLVKGCVLMAKDMKLKFEVTEQNISKVFDFFTMQVLETKKDSSGRLYKVYADGSEITPREQANLFMSWLLGINDTKNYYYHPTKKGQAVFGNKIVKVKRNAYLAFQNTYKLDKYALEDKKIFTATCDRLIEDAERRSKGDFYTPTAWVDEGHKKISEILGENWKDEYVVWDCCCGTKNLTRDYKFRQLYSSTIEDGDITLSKRYNQTIGEYEGVAFQYDFLNDDVEFFKKLLERKRKGEIITEKDFQFATNGGKFCKLYSGYNQGIVRAMLQKKPILFLINPPYGTANNLKTKHSGEEAKVGVSKTEINKLMQKNKLGTSSQQLFSQFLYRIILLREIFDLEKCCIALYSNASLLSSPALQGIRELLNVNSKCKYAMMFQASQFADCSSNWGVLFSIWQFEKIGFYNQESHTIIDVEIKCSEIDEICTKGNKKIWNLDNISSCSDWVKEPVKNVETFDSPQLSSGVVCKEKGIGKLAENSIGYYVNVGNNVYKNSTDIYIVNSCSSMGHGVSILNNNFYRVISNFTARKLISGKYATWINDKDEYMIPNIEHPKYKQWEADCLVYSLFNTSSNQTSLRGINYNGKKWDIKNEWFFMSEEEIKKLASGYYNEDDQNDDIESDIENFGGDRFVYKELCKIELSEDAQKVLDKARELVRKSFWYRDEFYDDNKDFHINTWDAGWYQVKALLKEYYPDELEEFNKLYHSFEDRMRPLVYELGFLYK